MLAVIPLIPLGYAAAAAGAAALIGWVAGRVKKGDEIKKQDEKVEHLESMVQQVIDNQEQDSAPPEEDMGDPTAFHEPEEFSEEVAEAVKEYNRFCDEHEKTTNEILSQDLMKPKRKKKDIPEKDPKDRTRFDLMDL